jgi:hypothetical protein
MGAGRNRRAGNTWELDCAKKLKERGIYPMVATSRYANRRRDHVDKIDLCNIDEHTHGVMTDSIQTKNTSKREAYNTILDSMGIIPGTRKVIYHRLTKKTGKVFSEVGQYAIMHLDDHVDLLAHWKAARILISILQHLPEDKAKEVREQLTLLGIPS